MNITIDIPGILTGVGIILLIVSIIILAFKKTTNVTLVKSDNPEDLKKFMEQNNFPKEMIQNISENNGTFTTNVTTTQTTRTVKYVNGELVSDATKTITNTPLTNCPRCGAMIEPGNNGICRFCNTTFNNNQINQ